MVQFFLSSSLPRGSHLKTEISHLLIVTLTLGLREKIHRNLIALLAVRSQLLIAVLSNPIVVVLAFSLLTNTISTFFLFCIPSVGIQLFPSRRIRIGAGHCWFR